MTEEVDEERDEGGRGGKTLGSRLPGASLEARIYNVGAHRPPLPSPLPVEHIAKATPSQRMNGRQRRGASLSLSLHVLTYLRTYAGNIAST